MESYNRLGPLLSRQKGRKPLFFLSREQILRETRRCHVGRWARRPIHLSPSQRSIQEARIHATIEKESPRNERTCKTPTRSLWYPHFPSRMNGTKMRKGREGKGGRILTNAAGFMSPFITPPDENVSPQAEGGRHVDTASPPLILYYYSWNTGNSVAVLPASFPRCYSSLEQLVPR